MLVHKTTGAKHGCQVVVVATGTCMPSSVTYAHLSWVGVSKPHDNPVSTGGQLLEHYHSVQPADTSFRNKSVCIIGTGQSAVETAQDLVQKTHLNNKLSYVLFSRFWRPPLSSCWAADRSSGVGIVPL